MHAQLCPILVMLWTRHLAHSVHRAASQECRGVLLSGKKNMSYQAMKDIERTLMYITEMKKANLKKLCTV